jgi:hypothetical protein
MQKRAWDQDLPILYQTVSGNWYIKIIQNRNSNHPKMILQTGKKCVLHIVLPSSIGQIIAVSLADLTINEYKRCSIHHYTSRIILNIFQVGESILSPDVSFLLTCNWRQWPATSEWFGFRSPLLLATQFISIVSYNLWRFRIYRIIYIYILKSFFLSPQKQLTTKQALTGWWGLASSNWQLVVLFISSQLPHVATLTYPLVI